jgi:hypothetical protein
LTIVVEEIEDGEHERGPDDKHDQRVGDPVTARARRNRTPQEGRELRVGHRAGTLQRSARVKRGRWRVSGSVRRRERRDAELARDIGVDETRAGPSSTTSPATGSCTTA